MGPGVASGVACARRWSIPEANACNEAVGRHRLVLATSKREGGGSRAGHVSAIAVQVEEQLLGHDAPGSMKRRQDAPASPDRAGLEQQLETLQLNIRRLQLEKDLLKKANELLKKSWASTGSA